MTCQAVIREISNYIDGDLDAEIRGEIEAHLKDCKDCQVIIDQTKLTVDIFCDSEMVELPDDARQRLHQALRWKMAQTR